MEEILSSARMEHENEIKGNLKVLICEDNLMTQKLLEFSLAGMGFEILTAADGEKGISILKKGAVDLVLTDINMPYNSGLELIHFIRANFKQKIPIFIVSNMQMDETRKHAEELGADRYFTKPFDPKQLIGAIKSLGILD